MRLLRISLTVLTCTVLIAVGALVFLLQTHPDFSITERPAQPTDKAVRMLFLGTSSMAWTDGQSTWLVDGFFSRQPVGEVLLSRLNVEEGRVLEVLDEVFRRLEIPAALSGIVVAHSHYDHALDAPFLAMQFGARLYGSQSTWQIAQGQNLPAMQMEVMQKGGVASLGQFEVKLVLSAHAPTGFTGGFNTQPLRLPARALSFKEGLSYSFVVSHPALGPAPFALIQPSAGFARAEQRVDSEYRFSWHRWFGQAGRTIHGRLLAGNGGEHQGQKSLSDSLGRLYATIACTRKARGFETDAQVA